MVGTGIFTTSGFIMEELGNPQAMLLCWLVGGVFALCGALCYGELGAMLTVVGMMLLRIKKPDLKRSYKTFGYPVTPLLFISGNLWIIYFCIKSRPITSLFGLGTIGLGVLFYTYFKKKNRIAGKDDSA